MMLDVVGIITIVINISILLIILLQMTKSGRFISKKSSIFLIPTFISVYMIYVAGISYSGENNINSAILGVQYSVLTFALRFNFEVVRNALDSSIIYYVAFYTSIGLAALLSVIVVVAVVLGKFVNKLKTIKILKNPIVIIGYSEDALIFYHSIKANNKYFIIPNDEEIIKIFLRDNIKYLLLQDNVYTHFLKPKSKASFISFLNDGFMELSLIEQFKKYSIEYPNCFYSLKILTDDKNISSYQSIINNHPSIFAFNHNMLITKKLMLEYQLSSFMDENQIDYKNAVLKNDTNVDVYMIGFGSVNKTIYQELVKNNQFVKLGDKKYEAYQVNYRLFDNQNSYTNLNMNYNLHHINEIDTNNKYFKAPDKIDNTKAFTISIDDLNFFLTIKDYITKNTINDIVYFYVSLGNELINIDVAIKLRNKIKEWNSVLNFKIFAHIEHESIVSIKELNEFKEIILFGAKEQVLSYPIVVEDFLDEYAKRRALYYSLVNSNEINIDEILSKLKDPKDPIHIKKNEIWNQLDSYQKESNTSSVLSIFSKLNMLGLKVSDNCSKAITADEFLNIYDTKHILNLKKISYHIRDGKNHLSPRDALAFMEHLRWNAFMIVKGYMPMPINSMRVYLENGKIKMYKNDNKIRQHACITSFDGLEDYFNTLANMIVKEANISFDEAFDMVENKKYDYILMDTVYLDIKLIGKYIEEI